MKWTIKRVKYRSGYFWEATRPDGMWITRRSWDVLIIVVGKAMQYQAARKQLYNHTEGDATT